MTPKEYDQFVRDTVNFLDYIGEPMQLGTAQHWIARTGLPAGLLPVRLFPQEGVLEGREVTRRDARTSASNATAVMTLFSRADDPWSHRTRIVLAEKSIHVETIDVQGGNLPEDLLDLNPYHTVPTLVDRDLVLYDSRVIIEYLDERFPHPPLMPVDPVARAQFRLALYRIERDWYSLAQQIDDVADRKKARSARKILRDSILASTDVFKAKPYFLSDEFSLVGCHDRADPVAPAGWEIDLPPQAQVISKYANLFLAAGLSPQPVARRAGDARLITLRRTMAETPPVRSRRPYLLRAMHEWISDSNQTPHIVVDASIEGVEVPRQYVQGGKIILNVSTTRPACSAWATTSCAFVRASARRPTTSACRSSPCSGSTRARRGRG